MLLTGIVIVALVFFAIGVIGYILTRGEGFAMLFAVSLCAAIASAVVIPFELAVHRDIAREATRRFTIETEGRTFENCRLGNGRYVTADGAEIRFGKSLVLIRETTREAIGSEILICHIAPRPHIGVCDVERLTLPRFRKKT